MKWWHRSKKSAGSDARHDRDGHKRVPQRRRRHVQDVPPGRHSREQRGSWDEQSDWVTRYGDPFDG
jgi:hypothetical protein